MNSKSWMESSGSSNLVSWLPSFFLLLFTVKSLTTMLGTLGGFHAVSAGGDQGGSSCHLHDSFKEPSGEELVSED
jgi:hypothetical protein